MGWQLIVNVLGGLAILGGVAGAAYLSRQKSEADALAAELKGYTDGWWDGYKKGHEEGKGGLPGLRRYKRAA